MFANRLVQIESNVDVAVQCLYYYCSLVAIDLFDKVSDLKTEQSNARNRQKGFLFIAHHMNRITIDLSRTRRMTSNKKRHNMMFFHREREKTYFYLYVLIDHNYIYIYIFFFVELKLKTINRRNE